MSSQLLHVGSGGRSSETEANALQATVYNCREDGELEVLQAYVDENVSHHLRHNYKYWI